MAVARTPTLAIAFEQTEGLAATSFAGEGHRANVCGVTGTAAESDEFVLRADQYRPELLAYCYRMLGSLADAEDAVQETYVRAWRAFDSFEERASLRTWLYRIATNTCLSALKHHGRRVLPSGLGAPSQDSSAPPNSVDTSVTWLQPFPDDRLPDSNDPAAIVTARDTVRLALVASLQYLPPRQRVVLILREVLAWSAVEVAELLDISVAAVKSALQRARARLDDVAPVADQVGELTEPQQRELLDRYVAAFEKADPAALERLLRADATLEAPPLRRWYSGIRYCMPYMGQHVLGSPGHWRMLPASANGQPAVAAYHRGADGGYLPYGIVVLTADAEGISRITAFGDADLVTAFGFPAVPPDA
ncbi:sigma-70 family RNA polymerase sigma factor [Kribbella koreensis]|uniref:Sigma-70 family RNA polymerase sigma factor n=2 Tax=Kribbella koreensis TaxID=57909 RepID=A0ABN1R089_9ACTN